MHGGSKYQILEPHVLVKLLKLLGSNPCMYYNLKKDINFLLPNNNTKYSDQ